MSDSVWLHGWQPTRLPCPWDSPGKNTGVSCHFLLQCMKVKSEREVAQSCLTLGDPIDGSPPGSRSWDSPGKNTGVGCHFLLQCMKVKMKSFSHVQLLATPWSAAYQAPPMGFSRQEYWSGVPLSSLMKKSKKKTNDREGMVKKEPYYTTDRNVNWYSHYGKQ